MKSLKILILFSIIYCFAVLHAYPIDSNGQEFEEESTELIDDSNIDNSELIQNLYKRFRELRDPDLESGVIQSFDSLDQDKKEKRGRQCLWKICSWKKKSS